MFLDNCLLNNSNQEVDVGFAVRVFTFSISFFSLIMIEHLSVWRQNPHENIDSHNQLESLKRDVVA